MSRFIEGDKNQGSGDQMRFDTLPRTAKGRIKWSVAKKDEAAFSSMVEAEAAKLFESGGILSKSSLKRNGQGELMRAIDLYPGGISELRAKFELSEVQESQVEGAEIVKTGLDAEISTRTPVWTDERIEKAAREFLSSTGELSFRSLFENGRGDLAQAISKRMKGIVNLKERLGILEAGQKPVKVDMETGDYTDENGQKWAPLTAYSQRLGVSYKAVLGRLEGARFQSGWGKNSGVTKLYNETDVANAIREFSALPMVNKDTGVYADSDGKNWAPGSFNKRFGIDYKILARISQDVPSIDGRSRAGQEVKLFLESDVQELIEAGDYQKKARARKSDKATYAAMANEEMLAMEIFGSNGEKLIPLNQQSGSELLRSYLEGQIPFDSLQPFMIKALLPSGDIRVGAVRSKGRERRIYIPVGNKLREAIDQAGSLLAIPKQDESNLYQWIDFHNITDNQIAEEPVDSVRIDAENQTIKKKGWNGPEVQLFLDYLAGKIDISPSKLKQFKSLVNPSLVSSIGEIDGKALSIASRQPLWKPGVEINYKPKFDSRRNYLWLEGYVPDENGQETMVVNRKIQQGDFRFFDWKGPENQALVDWIMGAMQFELVDPVLVPLDTDWGTKSLYSNGREATIKIASPQLRQFQEVLLVPKRDEFYEWIEVFGKKDEDTDFDLQTPATSLRVTRDRANKLDGNSWLGPERQRLIDYLEEKISPTAFEPFTARVGSKSAVYIFAFSGRSFSVTLGDVLEGETVNIVPSIDAQHNLTLNFNKSEGAELGSYSFDNVENKLIRVNSLKKPPSYWTEERIKQVALDVFEKSGRLSYVLLNEAGLQRTTIIGKFPGELEELRSKLGVREKLATVPLENGRFEDEDSEIWLTKSAIGKEFSLAKKGIEASLEGIPLLQVINKRTGNVSTLYKRGEFEKRLSSSIVNPVIDPRIGTYIDKEGINWLTAKALAEKTGLQTPLIMRHLKTKGTTSIKGRFGLRQIDLFEVGEAVNILNEYSQLPQVSVDSGIYIDGNGEKWAPVFYLANSSSIGRGIPVKMLEGVQTIRGRDKTGRETVLYKVSETEGKLNEISTLPVVDKKTGKYVDEQGDEWGSVNGFAKDFKVYFYKVSDIVSEMNFIVGISRSGKIVNLYRKSDIQKALNEEQKTSPTLTPEYANEQLRGLLDN